MHAPGWTRTTDQQLRRLLLYPAELRAPNFRRVRKVQDPAQPRNRAAGAAVEPHRSRIRSPAQEQP